MTKRWLTSLKKPKRRGATAVEFALTAPVAFLLLCASIEFGRANLIMNSTANAAYQGARRGIVPGATSALASAEAQNVLTASSVKTSTVTVSPSVIQPTTTTVQVTVSVPLSSNLWIGSFFTKNITITRTCTLTREKSV